MIYLWALLCSDFTNQETNIHYGSCLLYTSVSHPTVSKALNNAPGVSDETRRKILKLAAQMNYTPNMAAKRLANKGNRSIGFIWPKAEGIFFYHLANALQEEAGARGIDVVAVSYTHLDVYKRQYLHRSNHKQ